MPDVSLAELPVQVALALSLASSSTGADYDYLLKTAQRESSFRSDAKATTSSAEGLFQFIDETWIRTVKDEGPALGLAGYADKITKTAEGRYVIANAKDRDAILDLRRDPKISALMAGAFSRRNEERLAAGIGRAPTSGELYIAHLLGAGDASRLIRIRGVDMSIAAADLFPRAAAANRTLFYRSGKALSAGELYDRLIALHAHRPKIAIKDDGAVSGDVAVGSWKADVARRIVFTKEEAAKLGWAYLNDLAQREPSVFGWGRKSSRKVAPQEVDNGGTDEAAADGEWSTAVEAATASEDGGVGFGSWAPTAADGDPLEAMAKVVAKAKAVRFAKAVAAEPQLAAEAADTPKLALRGNAEDAADQPAIVSAVGDIAMVAPAADIGFGLRSNAE